MRFVLTLLVRARVPLLALLGVTAAAAAGLVILGTTHATASTTCNYFWTGKDAATPTVWNDKKNWSLTDGGAASTSVPNGSAYACMSTSPTTSTAVITANTNVGGLNWPSVGTVNVSGGIFAVGAVGTSTLANLQLEGGTLSGTASVTTASLDSGTLKSGTITLTGASTIAVPTVSDHLINAGTLTHSGDAGFTYLAGATAFLENSGHYNEQNGYYGINWDGTSGGQVVNDSGAIWTLNVSPTDPNYPTTHVYAPFQNNGTVAAPSGLLDLAAGDPGTTTDAGTWQGPNAGSGILLGGGNRTEGASVTSTGPGPFDVTASTVTFTAGSSLSALGLDGGTIQGTTTAGNAVLNTGTIASPGTITLTGTSTVGSITISGHLLNAGTLTHSGDTGFIYLAGATAFLENSGTFNELNGYYGMSWDSTIGGQVVNDAGATWTLNVSPTDPNFPNTYLNAPFQNNGTVAAPSGLLNMGAGDPGTTTDAGAWHGPNVGSGIVLAGGNRTETASVTTSGPGAFDVTGATVTFTAGSSLSTLSLDGGTISGTTTAGNAVLNSGTIASPGTITLTGTSTVGSITISGHLLNAGALTHSGDTGFIYITSSTGLFENSGHYNEQNGYYGITWDSTIGGQAVNDAGATWTLNVSTTDPNYPNTYIYAPFQNNGTVAAPSGLMNVEAGDPGTAVDAGTWQGPNAGSGIVLAAGNRTEAATVTTSGPGAFDVTGATVAFTAGSSLSTLSVDGGTISGTTTVATATLNSGSLVSPGTITLTGTSTVGGISVSDHLTNAGTLTHTGDSGFITVLGGTGVFENSGTFNEQDGYYGTTWDSAAGDQVVNDAGATWTLNVSPSDPNYASTYMQPPFQNNGTLAAHSGTLVFSTLSNLNGGTTLTGGTYTTSGGTLEISGDVTTNAATITLGASGAILDASAVNALTGLTTNSGTLNLAQSLTTTGALANSGHVNVTGGKLRSTSYSQSGSTSSTAVGNGATLQAGGGAAAIAINGGTLSGTGVVAGAVSGGGSIQPGAPTGTLTDTGTYSPSSAGTLATDIGSAGATNLAVVGAVTLSSNTLAITTDSAFTPTVGTAYTVLSGSGLSGTFGTVTGLPAAGGSYGYQVGYSSTAVTVTVIPSVSISNATAAQQPSSNSTATFTATLSAAINQPVSVNYVTSDGSAVAGSDYTAASGTVTFPANVTSEQITVTVLPDAICDPNEAFAVTLSTPVNTIVNQGSGTGTITNASPCMTVTSVNPNHVGDGAPALVVTIHGSGFSTTAANDSVKVSGAGVTTKVSSATTTTISVQLKVLATAAIGARDVTVTTGGNQATCTGCLTVDAAPVVTSLSPNILATGATSIPVTLTGSNFTAPVTVTLTGPVGSPKTTAKVTSVSSTSVTLAVTVAQGTVASNIAYTVKATNTGDGGIGSKMSAFSVEQGPTFTSISPSSVVRGAASVPVTLQGTGFFSGMTVIASKGVTITITTVSPDGTQATGTMKAAATATTGSNLPVTIVEPAANGSGRATRNSLTVS